MKDIEKTLEALFVINKKAKQYAQRGTEAYEQGWGGLAKTDSLRKRALYELKSYVLARLYLLEDIDKIELHYIDGSKYYCLQIRDHQFHTPVSEFEDVVDSILIDATIECEVDIEPSEIVEETTGAKHLDEFTTSKRIPGEMMSEREALQHLATEFRSANTFIHPFNDGRPIGWSYLPEYIEEGTILSEFEFQEQRTSEFLFAVGDSFETIEHGRVTVVDRYGRWLSRRFSRDPILPRPVYDIDLHEVDERKTGIRRECIMDDWRIHVEDPSDPLPDVNGTLADQIDSYNLDFDVGDILTLDRGLEEDPTEWTVNHFTICGFLLEVHLRPCNEEWIEPLTPEEFVDDIVEITHT